MFYYCNFQLLTTLSYVCSLVIACPRGIAIVDMSEQMDDDMSDNTNDDTNEDTDVRPKRRRLEPKWMADYVMIKE